MALAGIVQRHTGALKQQSKPTVISKIHPSSDLVVKGENGSNFVIFISNELIEKFKKLNPDLRKEVSPGRNTRYHTTDEQLLTFLKSASNLMLMIEKQ